MSDPLTPAQLMAQFIEQIGTDLPAPTVSATDPFFTYDRPPTFGVHAEQIEIPMNDGGFLTGELHRPATPDGDPAPGPFPGIVFEFNGYDAVQFFAAGAGHFVTRGYIVVVCNVRGTGGSPGTVDPFGPQEQKDNAELIEWLAALPFCTGKVGQMGVSYGGHNSLLAAVNAPEHLTTVIAVQAFSDWYENTIYRGGIANAQIRDWQRDTAPETLQTYPQHPLYDEYWKDRSVKARWDRLRIPVLDVGGWLDPYRLGMVENFRARPEQTWMVAGPWSHGMVPGQFEDIGAAAYLAWLDYWLSDLPGALPQARVTSYEMPREGWRQYADWPPPESRPVTFVLASGGRLLPGESATGESTVSTFDVSTGSLVFETEPGQADLVIAGELKADVRLAFSASDGNVAVVLEEVDKDGASTRITNGWLRASHRDGSAGLAAVEPGDEYVLSVTLWPAHHRLLAGHRLRVTLSSRDFPLIDDNAPDGTVSVRLGDNGSSLSLQALR
ncbi:CocE/NonD family hydrolase [Kribbella sp. NPDC051620]|uniref:CocE/NonD family hydrolase n=1 Tax=Kribbella sp. NPDC051620 TaxID=3364120 RepID=UPI0037B62589